MANAKPETDTENWDSWAIIDGSGGVGKNAHMSRMVIGHVGSCDDCKFEEFFLSAWSVGDPAVLVNASRVLKDPSAAATTFCTGAEFGDPGDSAYPNCAQVLVPVPLAVDSSAYRRALLTKTYADESLNVCHRYINDHTKFRIHHGGTIATHVHHQNAHQWLISPNSDQGAYLDSQMISPGASYRLEMTFNGSGNHNKVVGDSILHCHFYPHFAAGMWGMWRTDETFEVDSQFNARGIYRTLNKEDWDFPKQLNTLWSQAVYLIVGHTNGGSRRSFEPLFLRGSSGVIVEYWHTNLAPNYYGVDDFQVRTPTDILGQHVHLVRFDVTSSDGLETGFNLDRTVRTVFTHDYFGSLTNYQAGLYASLLIEPNDLLWRDYGSESLTGSTVRVATNTELKYREFMLDFPDLHLAFARDSRSAQDTLTPLMRAYPNDSVQIRVLVGAHEFAPQFRSPISTSFASPVFTIPHALTKLLVDNDRGKKKAGTTVVDLQTNTPVAQDQPCHNGAIAKTEGDKLTAEEAKSRDQQSAYVMDVPRDFPKALLANANERTLTILFWVFLFGTMVNTLSTTSAIILAWMSNNRAKAELVLKQADALREAKERELRIKELELRLAQLERQASAPSGLIVVAS